MNYKGQKITKPTLAMFEEYCKEHLLDVPPEKVYNHYFRRGWMTKAGKEAVSIEAMCNAWNSVWLGKIKKQKGKVMTQREVARLEVLNNAKEEYSAYKDQLNDSRWKAFRQFIFKIRGCSCEICGSKKYLQIHHPKYHANCKAWEYSCKDVIVVCNDCHKKIHGIKGSTYMFI